jgi:hypothetical protein
MKRKDCPACGGLGGDVEPVLDDGTGPWMECGFCQGRGWHQGRMYYVTLGYLSAQAHKQPNRPHIDSKAIPGPQGT